MPNEARITELQNDIKSYERSLKRRPNDDNLHHIKGNALNELGNLTFDVSYYDTALAAYNQAIKLAPQNAMYLADRSKLYITMDRPDLATQDIVAAQSSPTMGNRVLDMYHANTVKDVLKLDSVQGEVHKLIKAGKIPNELEGVFTNMVQVISGISNRVSAHDNRLNEHDERFDAQAIELQQLKTQLVNISSAQTKPNEELMNIIKFMTQQIGELQGKVSEHDESIQALTEQMSQFCTKDEFDVLAKRFEVVESEQTLFGGKVKLMQGTIDNQAKAIINIDKTLEAANCYNKQTIREEFAQLKAENSVLYDYANNFYWGMSNYLLAYRSISTGKVPGIRDTNQLDNIWGKFGSLILKATGSIPLIGHALTIIEEGIISINDKYKSIEFDRKVAKINKLITSHILEEDLNLAVASAAIKIAKLKSVEILAAGQFRGPQPKATSFFAKTKETFNKAKDMVDSKIKLFDDKIDQIVTQLCKINNITKTAAMELAIKDVVLFLNHIATHELELVKADRLAALDQTLTEAFSTNVGSTEVAVRKAVTEASASNNSKADKDKCIVAILSDIIYDNELLNHPKLLQAAAKHYGMNKTIDSTMALSPELIDEAIACNDAELVLAGIMSLETV